jgi:hypothetical protein
MLREGRGKKRRAPQAERYPSLHIWCNSDLFIEITVFVPTEAVEVLTEAVFATGAARYGNYTNVLWKSGPGIEQFTPLEGSSPTLGQIDKAETNASIQLMFSIPRDQKLLERILAVTREFHPWEEPVIYVDECTAVQTQPDIGTLKDNK